MGKSNNLKIVEATVKGRKNGEKIILKDSVVEGKVDSLPQASKRPTTTEQEDITLAGQRRINLIWEYTQAMIAVVVVGVNMLAALVNVFRGRDIDVPMILSSSLFLIIGFYFSRTNHQAIGGIGKKANEDQEFKGR